MNIKRYVENDMRQAMRKVREELGPDAVILSSSRKMGRTEVVAAVDYDEKLFGGFKGSEVSATKSSTAAISSSNSLDDVLAEASAGAEPSLADLQRELANLRGLFEGELSKIAWKEMGRREPNRMGLQNRLTSLGLGQELCSEIIDRVTPCNDLEQGWRQVLEVLASSIHIADADILNDGGVIAVVGPTGVGKTTTVAKLAARFCLRHGRKEVALITTDSFRIGGQEQLFTFGSILGIPVQVATSPEELSRALASVSDRKLVLVDTAGMSQRDMGLSEQFATLAAGGSRVKPYLVLSAISQGMVISEAIQAFGSIGLAGAIVTKADEAASLGPVITSLIKHRLPLSFIGNGQRVPEDLLPARAETLVADAVKLAEINKKSVLAQIKNNDQEKIANVR